MLNTVLDLVLPLTCPGCGASSPWCERCAAPLSGLPRRLPGAFAESPVSPPAYALARYDGSVRAVILAAKEHGRRDLPALLGAVFGVALARLVRIAALVSPLWLVPAPSRRAAARRRGGDPITVMARAAAGVLAAARTPAGVAPCLVTAASAADSVGLDAAQRQANLAGRVRYRQRAGPPPGAACLLIDDVLTTGTTAAAAARVLIARDHPVQAVLTLAAAHRWWTGPAPFAAHAAPPRAGRPPGPTA